MLPNPSFIQKYLYIEKSSTWKIRSLHFFGFLSWLLIGYSYVFVIGIDPFFTFFVTPLSFFIVSYHLITLGIILFYKQFNLKEHYQFVRAFWEENEPSLVDIFLPICGEDSSILQNTWQNVSKLAYTKKHVYVLDDSKEGCEEHRKLAERFGFTYLERQNKGHMKKAGNLKHAYEISHGKFIVIFDADFAPHPDFITEILPYMRDPNVGIVQTPQYYDTSNEAYTHSHIAYNEAYAEEPFYRFIQVTRSRFRGALCCGSNAIYRRSAIDQIGGPYQIEHSEDAHTGFEMTIHGYRVLYVPIIVAIGLGPNNYYAFFHQQHRWCMGSMSLMLSKRFWFAPISWKIKLCYITGFLFYLHHPVTILFSFHLFWVLFLYNDYAHNGSLLYYPHIIFSILYIAFFPIAKLRIGYFTIPVGRTYAYSHAVITAFLRRSVGWVSTNAKHKAISSAFQQTTQSVIIYIILYSSLILIGLRTGDIRLFDWRYWSIQLWIAWNFVFTCVLLIKLIQTKRAMLNKKLLSAKITDTIGYLFTPRTTFATVPAYQLAIFSFVIGFLIGFPVLMFFMSRADIKAVQTEVLSARVMQTVTPTQTPVMRTSPTPTVFLLPTSTSSLMYKKQTLVAKKEYGGWYWQKNLGRSQRWVGTDNNGKDLWTD